MLKHIQNMSLYIYMYIYICIYICTPFGVYEAMAEAGSSIQSALNNIQRMLRQMRMGKKRTEEYSNCGQQQQQQ